MNKCFYENRFHNGYLYFSLFCITILMEEMFDPSLLWVEHERCHVVVVGLVDCTSHMARAKEVLRLGLETRISALK